MPSSEVKNGPLAPVGAVRKSRMNSKYSVILSTFWHSKIRGSALKSSTNSRFDIEKLDKILVSTLKSSTHFSTLKRQ
jgi:hypothetical protein